MSTCPNFHVTVGHAGDCGRGLAASSFSHGCWRVDKPWPGARPGLPALQTLEDEAGKMSRAAQKTSPAKKLQLSTRPKERAAGPGSQSLASLPWHQRPSPNSSLREEMSPSAELQSATQGVLPLICPSSFLIFKVIPNLGTSSI